MRQIIRTGPLWVLIGYQSRPKILTLLKFFGQSVVLQDPKVLIRNAKGNKLSPKPTKVNEHVCEKKLLSRSRAFEPVDKMEAGKLDL